MRTRRTLIVLVSGKAKSGKGEVADFLQRKFQDIPSLNVFRYAFAGPLKYIATAFMGWDGKKDDAGRKLLQDLGRIGRAYDENIWVKHLLNQMDKKSGILPFNVVIVDDWRFPNELEFLKNNPLLDVATIRIFGRGGLEGDAGQDVSENSLPDVSDELIPTNFEGDHYYDFQISNTNGIEQLEKKVDIVLAELSRQYIVE